MTKEQIEQQAKKSYPPHLRYTEMGDEDWNSPKRNAFVEGANWLLDNLWISVEDELPPFDETVIVHYKERDSTHGVMFSHRTEDVNVVKDNHDFCICCDEIITHWMPIPKLNEK